MINDKQLASLKTELNMLSERQKQMLTVIINNEQTTRKDIAAALNKKLLSPADIYPLKEMVNRGLIQADRADVPGVGAYQYIYTPSSGLLELVKHRRSNNG